MTKQVKKGDVLNLDMTAVLVAVVGSGGFGALVPWLLDRFDHRSDPLHEGVKELLFCRLELLHRQMVEQGGVASVHMKQTAERIYAAYSGLGGNGTGTSMIEDIRKAHITQDADR